GGTVPRLGRAGQVQREFAVGGMRRFLTALALCFLPLSFAASQDQGKTGVATRESAFDAAQLEERLRKLGPGDLSVIAASASKPGSAMTTSRPLQPIWTDF